MQIVDIVIHIAPGQPYTLRCGHSPVSTKGTVAGSDLWLVVGPSKQASKHTHMHVHNEVMLAWDSLRLAPIMDWIAQTIKEYLAKALIETSLTHLIIRLYLAIDFPTIPFVETGECPYLRVYGWSGAIYITISTICMGLPGLY